MLNKRGSTLVLVLLVMSVLTILGIVILNVSLAENRFSIHNVNKMQAYNTAKSGADIIAKKFIANPNDTTTSVAESLGNGSFNVAVTKPDSNTIRIDSQGTVNSVNQSVSLVLIKVHYSDLFLGIRQTGTGSLDLTALPITYDPGSTVLVEANSSNTSQISLTSANNSDPNIIKSINTTPMPDFVLPNTSGYQTSVSGLTLTGNYNLVSLSKGNNQTMIFDTQGSDQHIVVNSLDISGPHGELEISGGGAVHLYVTGSANIQTPVMVNTSNPARLFIYVAPYQTISLSANGNVNAYIYAPKATVEIQSSQTLIIGSIIGNIINRGNTNGAHGNFHYSPLSQDPDDTPINVFKKSLYLN